MNNDWKEKGYIDEAVDESVDGFADGLREILNAFLLAFGNGQIDTVIGFCDIAVHACLLFFADCH